MAVPSITSLPPKPRRSTHHDYKPRPAAHRARYSAKRLAAIRRRRARVLAVRAWFVVNARLLAAGFATGAVLAVATVLLVGLADPVVRFVLATAAVIVFLAYSLDLIARRTAPQDGDVA